MMKGLIKMEKFRRISNESLLTHYLLIQKDLSDMRMEDLTDEKVFYEMCDKSKELKDEILRRMKHGRRKSNN